MMQNEHIILQLSIRPEVHLNILNVYSNSRLLLHRMKW